MTLMNDQDIPTELIIALVALVTCFAFLTGTYVAGKSYQEQAVSHGAAEYYLDSKGGRHWHWKGDK